jgi:hypothetical protein
MPKYTYDDEVGNNGSKDGDGDLNIGIDSTSEDDIGRDTSQSIDFNKAVVHGNLDTNNDRSNSLCCAVLFLDVVCGASQ